MAAEHGIQPRQSQGPKDLRVADVAPHKAILSFVDGRSSHAAYKGRVGVNHFWVELGFCIDLKPIQGHLSGRDGPVRTLAGSGYSPLNDRDGKLIGVARCPASS